MLMALAACAARRVRCGAGNHRDVGLKNVPLPRGAQITARVRVCDRGANAYCAEQLVVAGPALRQLGGPAQQRERSA